MKTHRKDRRDGVKPMKTADETPPIVCVANRFASLFERAVQEVKREGVEASSATLLRYWDTYYGPAPSLAEENANWHILDVIPKKIINPLANKRQLPALLTEAGIHDVSPATYLSVEEALNHQGEAVSIWFFKSIYGTGGKNMYCVANEYLDGSELPSNFVIQAGVRNLSLIDGKKFTARIYVLIWHGRVFLYRNGFLMVHAELFDEASTDYAVQIDHFGYEKPDSRVKMKQLMQYEQYDAVMGRYLDLIKRIKPVLADTIKASSQSSYILLGIDTLIQTDGNVKLIEINTFPNFVHTSEIIDQVNVPFFKAAIRTMLGESIPTLIEV